MSERDRPREADSFWFAEVSLDLPVVLPVLDDLARVLLPAPAPTPTPTALDSLPFPVALPVAVAVDDDEEGRSADFD